MQWRSLLFTLPYSEKFIGEKNYCAEKLWAYNAPTKIRKLFAVLQYKTKKISRSLEYIDLFISTMPVAYRLHFHKVSCDIFIADKLYYCADKIYIVRSDKNSPIICDFAIKSEKFSRSLRSLGYIFLFACAMPTAYHLHYHACSERCIAEKKNVIIVPTNCRPNHVPTKICIIICCFAIQNWKFFSLARIHRSFRTVKCR